MGDRANVFIQQEFDAEAGEWAGVGVYSHWGGREFQERAALLIEKAIARKGDPHYFARILLQNILSIEFDADSATGGGVWVSGLPDNEYPVLVINAMTGMHWWCKETEYRKDQP